MTTTIETSGPPPVFAAGKHHAPQPIRGASIIVLDLTGPAADPVAEYLVDGTCRLFEELRALLEPTVTVNAVVTVVVADADPPDELSPVIDATFAAVQATVHSLALEHANSRLTVVRCTPGDARAVDDTISFLTTTGGAYISAATIDLRGAR